jgi:hypothetical protein
MKKNIFILIILVSIGCYGQNESINSVIKSSALIDFPVDYQKLSGIMGDSLREKFKEELSASEYFLIIKDKKFTNKPLSFQNLSLVGKVNLSSKYDIAIFREDINLNDAIYYLLSFRENGKLLSALKIIDRGNIPDVSSKISKEQVISIRKEYEDHIENYNFILEDDGIFKRTSYSEEKL